LRWLLFRECRRKLNCEFPSVRKALRAMQAPRPTLFIHGQRDSYIPVGQSQLLYKAAPGPKSLWAVPGAKHNQSVIIRPEYYEARGWENGVVPEAKLKEFPEPEWLEPLRDESAIKKAILLNEFSGQKVTPVQVDKVFKKYMAGREIMKNLSTLWIHSNTSLR